MGSDRLMCRACGTSNDVTAFACTTCGGPLSVDGSQRWEDARERDRVLDDDAAIVRTRMLKTRRTAMFVFAGALLGAVGAAGYGWFSRYYYVRGEPVYDGQPVSYWATLMVESPDKYMRRRGALAIESICEGFNEATAREVVPSLKRALEDPDETARRRAGAALQKIAGTTGVT